MFWDPLEQFMGSCKQRKSAGAIQQPGREFSSSRSGWEVLVFWDSLELLVCSFKKKMQRSLLLEVGVGGGGVCVCVWGGGGAVTLGFKRQTNKAGIPNW